MKKVVAAALTAALFSISVAWGAENCCGNGPKTTTLRRETNTQQLPPAPPVAEAENNGGSAFATDLPDRTSSRRNPLRAQEFNSVTTQDTTHGWTAQPGCADTCCNRCCNDSLFTRIGKELDRPFVGLEGALVEAQGKRLRDRACKLNAQALDMATEADKIESLKAEGCPVAKRVCNLESQHRAYECAQQKLAEDFRAWECRCSKLQSRKAALDRCE